MYVSAHVKCGLPCKVPDFTFGALDALRKSALLIPWLPPLTKWMFLGGWNDWGWNKDSKGRTDLWGWTELGNSASDLLGCSNLLQSFWTASSNSVSSLIAASSSERPSNRSVPPGFVTDGNPTPVGVCRGMPCSLPWERPFLSDHAS